MKKWMVFAIVSCLCVSVTCCARAVSFSDETIRYKMIVEVDTPEGIKTASAVREATRHREPSILPEQGGTTYNITKGEAVVVDLKRSGIFFVLLGGEREAKAVFQSLSRDKKQPHQSIKLSLPDYPRFIRFQDLNNPSTIESISHHNNKNMPNGYGGNALALQSVFGSDFSLLSISIHETDESDKSVVATYLPWFTERALLPGAIGGTPETPFKDPTNTWVTAAEIKK